MTLLNQSCDPNVSFHTGNSKRIIWIVCRPIKTGDQLYTTESLGYFTNDNINCSQIGVPTCQACRQNWANKINFPKLYMAVKIFELGTALNCINESFPPNNPALKRHYTDMNEEKMIKHKNSLTM